MNDPEAYGDRIWVLYAIALSKAPEATGFLQALQLKAGTNNARSTIGVGVDDIRYALSLRSHQHFSQEPGTSR